MDGSFSAFVAGLTIGVAGVLLLGTKEGRELSERVVKSIPKDLKTLFRSPNEPPAPPVPSFLKR